MSQHKFVDLIDIILDDAVAHPERVEELKRALRARIAPGDETARPVRETVSPGPWHPSMLVDVNDDSLWDNMPV